MEETNGTDNNDWAQFPSLRETDPSSFAVASSSFKISTETYPVLQQDDKVQATPHWEAILDQSLLQISSDCRTGLTDSTGEYYSEEPALADSLFKNLFLSETWVTSQELRRDEDGACSSDDNDNSPRRCRQGGQQGVGSSRNQQDDEDDGACSLDESTSENSPRRRTLKESNSNSALWVAEAVGGSPPPSVGPSGSSSDTGKRPFEMTEIYNTSHEEERARRGRPRVVPIEVYVIAPKSVEEVQIRLIEGVRHEVTVAEFSLGKGIDGKFFAWCWRGEIRFPPHEAMSAVYNTLTEEKPSLLRDMPFINRMLDAVGDRERTWKENRQHVNLPNHGVHVDICDDEGVVKPRQEYTLVEWLAVLRTLVAATMKYSFRDTFSEYFHKRPDQLAPLFLSRKQEPSEAVKVIFQWASHLRKEFREEFGSGRLHAQVRQGLAAKEGLVSVALLEMLVAVRNLSDERHAAKEEEYLPKAFLETLVPLRCFFDGARGDPTLLTQQEDVRNVLQATMGHLVSCVSPFSFNWVDHLDLFTFFDPAMEFLNVWRPFRFDSMSSREITVTAGQYEDAVWKLCTSDCFRSSPERRAASGSALQAAPTLQEFFQAARRQVEQGWLLGDQGGYESDDMQLMDEALAKCVSNITDQQHDEIKPGVLKSRLQRHLELAVNIEYSSVYPFLAASFRDHLLEILQQILSLEEQSSMKDPLSILMSLGSFSPTLADTILSVVTSPHAFTSPLRPREVRLIASLTATPSPKTYAGGRSALVSLANRDQTSYATYHEVLNVWVRGTARRKGSTGENLASVYLPPHAFLAALEELSDAGVEPSRIASPLSQMAMSMAVEECRSLPAFLQDSKKITPSQARLVQDHYLNAAGRMMDAVMDASQTSNHLIHETASDSLLAVCQRTTRGTLLFLNLIGEQLCVKLLETTMRACVDLQGELELQPIETMVEVKFATLLMQIEKCPQSVKSHPLYKHIYAACKTIGSSLKSGSVSLRYINLRPVREDWEKMFHIFGNPSFVTALENAHKDVVVYKNRLQGFKVLVEDVSLFLARSNVTVEGCAKWRDWFTRRSSEWESFTLNDIHSSPDHWPSEVHEAIYTYLDSIITLHRSRIFLNVLLELVLDCAAGGNAGLVTRVASSDGHYQVSLSSLACVLFPQAVNRYQDEMRLFVGHEINFDRVIMERVCILLNEVDPNAVEAEFEIACRQLGYGGSLTKTHELLKRVSPDKEPTIVDYLQSWKSIYVLRELHETLPLVASVFELTQDCGGLVSRIWNVITECTPRCTLRRFQAVLQRDGQALLTQFSRSEVDTLKELTKTGELIAFLKQTVQEDLRHLLDAVEDPNASQSWEGLINDLIDLQRIFRPILSATVVSFEDLRASIFGELKASSANFLCEKLKACNKDAYKLRLYFMGVANRTHKDNDQIAGILRSGQYHFLSTEDGCALELKCSDADPAISETSDKTKAHASSRGEKSFTLPQLQELRSRARWNVTSNGYVKKSKIAQALETDEEIDTSERSAIVFISHIDVAEHIVAVVTDLHNCGHFSFAKFQKVVHSFAELQMLADHLKSELRTWEAAMSKARHEFPCLNSFRSVELRLIVEELMLDNSTQPDEKLEHCLDLFKWKGVHSINVESVKRSAARSMVPQTVAEVANSSHDEKGDLIYNLLRKISSVIESSVFERKSNAGSATENSERGRGIVLADVDDPQGEIDAVATLFAERDLVLHGNASNVIVCGPLTPWEELYLLILRYLNDVGQENYFFCICFIERLSFECLSQLMTLLQKIVHEYPLCENELALVSCSRSKIRQTLSQRLQIQVRHMASGTMGAIGTEEGGRYSQMWVITSDLPGMGKTRHVEKFAETNHVDCMRTLTISGEVSRNVLIQRLKTLFLHLPPDQSASSVFLHLDISVVSNPETLNDLLFELLVLGCLKSDRAGLFHLTTQHVAIEVANTYHNFLASNLPVCRWFKTEHLVWNIHNFVPSDSTTSDDQLACNYLQSLEDGDVDKWNPGSSGTVVTIPFAQCRELLRRHFVEHLKDRRSISFSLLQTFIKFFARQLREFSDCPFFLPENLAFMRAHPNTRATVVRSILEVARDLSIRSVKAWLDEQQESTVSANAEALMAARMDNMQRWSDSKHVMIFFQLKGRMAVLYKHPRHLPTSLVDLFHKQKAKLPQYESLNSEQLYQELWPILHKSQPPAQDTSYVLTADNFLKMALIFMKVKANVPVVIMGETGCGKTSLLRKLAHYCSVVFLCITLHAGTTEDDIRMFLTEAESQAGDHVVWAFLDEINACGHLGFLVGVVCRRLLDGRPLHQNVKVLAACNPYRKHDSGRQRAGLSARKILKTGNLEHLDKAYTVHPLPEALVENVQDFGVLNPNDEQLYIQAMVRRIINTNDKAASFPFIKLLVMSQAFMKEKCGEASVSLRDATRCIDLLVFFSRDLESRPQSSTLPADRRQRRAALLAFAHCYYYRLANDKERTEYKAEYVKIMNAANRRAILTRNSYSESKFEKELFEEQMKLLDHMEIEPGIAKNQALRENVFVTLTCILQKIPLFVVGKPGSGKTLSLQLIFSNLRGSGMKDPYFRLQPTMFMFSYQGSESSTSDGILKVFERAYRCVEDNKRKNVNAVVVVVLDEVGLAEISSHNPLKVLHSLLEPDGEQKVAVVGISNWSLDAAKMNRAIHISQPDPSVTDLVATGEAILDSYGMRKIYAEEQMIEMKWLAKVYHEFHERQSKPDFHGLRDFYSLIKSLRGDPKMPKKWSSDDLKQALWRNFGGSPDDTDLLVSILSSHFRTLRFDPPPALDLVKANLDDKNARHLMLISTGESAIAFVEPMMHREKLIVVHGSKYKDDCSDDYAYLMLSNIILHMEDGRHILLKGVERIWSSLYDMLNQHYTIVGGRRNCRIAVGAFSNPMCYVHENFRCIVVVDQSQVQRLDPPFLNRFEKQVLTWGAILTSQQQEDEGVLKKWVKGMACISEDDSNVDLSFCENDLFANYSADTLASVLLGISNTESSSNNAAFLDRCKEELLLTAYPDGIMRALYSRKCLEEVPDAKKWSDEYFQKRGDQESLFYKICHHICDKSLWKDSLGVKLVVTTRSNIHTDIRSLLQKLSVTMQIIKLGDFTAERQLSTAIQQWSKSFNGLLVIQSDTVFDKDHLPLAKVHVERARAALLAQAESQSQSESRHVVFVLHSHRGEQQTASPFSFLSGWKQITLDQLHQEHTDYREYLDKSIGELVRSEKLREGHRLMVKALTWSFLCIKYPRGKQSAAYCQRMVEKICNDKDLYDCFIRRAVIWLEEDAKSDQESGKVWQTLVVCNRGRLALASNLHYAFSQFVEEKLREPIARLIYVLESMSALGSYFNMTHDQQALWRRVFMDREMVDIKNVPQPMHPEGYTIKDPLQLQLPFSNLYAEHVDSLFQELYLACVSDDEDAAQSLAVKMAKDVNASLQNNELMLEIEQCAVANPHDYCRDFALLYAPYQSSLRPASEALVFEWLLREKVPDLKPLMLHALVWTKLGTLKAQALLASSCYTEDGIATEVNIIKSSNAFSRDFDDKFASQCVLKMLPLDNGVIEKAGGLEKWLHQFGILIKLVSNISVGGSRLASIMLMLRVLQDFAQLVICPLSMAWEDLCSLAYWFERERFAPSPDSLITKITSLVADMSTLQETHRDVYFRFLASSFSRLLDSTSVTQGAILTMSTEIFNFRAPTCLMKGVMIRLLHSAAQLLIPAEPKLPCPPFLQLFAVNCRSVIREQAWSSQSYEPYVLLSDVIYESVRGFITPELMSGSVDNEAKEAFSFDEFFSFVRLTTRELTLPSKTLSLRVACAFAMLRSVIEVLAQDLVTVQKKDPTVFKPRLAPGITRTLTEFFKQSHYNVSAMKQYLMKVLRYHCGLSIQSVSYLANECRHKSLELYSLILDWDMLKEVDNPLGFNPFTTLFPTYEKTDELLWNSVYSEGEKLQKLKLKIQGLPLDEQGAIASAVASKIFLAKASRDLFEKEVKFTSWLLQEANLESWDTKWVEAVHCLAGAGPLQLTTTTTSQQLQFRALAAHLLLVVSSFPSCSPLQRYMALEVEDYVLASPNTVLSALLGALSEAVGDYRHSCGYTYVIGNCTQPNQKAKCPNCGGILGGSYHKLDAGNVALTRTIEKGYIPDHVARSDPMYTVRGVEMKTFRVLRIVVHCCMLLGLFLGRCANKFAAKLNMPVSSVEQEVETMIEEDLGKLGTLLNRNREVTCQFLHHVVASMVGSLPEEPLTTPASRQHWETSFQRLVNSLSGSSAHSSVADYIDAHRGRHELTELLEERRLPPFPAATAAFTRISVVPSFKNYMAMYMQDESRRGEYPIIAKFFMDMERLSEMKHLLALVRFSKAVHEQLCSKVTRPQAASTTVGEYLSSLTNPKDRRVQEWFPDFAKAWNVMRLKVTAFECTEFKQGIPDMNVNASIGFCLVESRDLGIYLAAILDHLRTIQNTFLGEVATAQQNQATTEGSSHLSVRVQACKAEDIINFDEQWPHTIVCHAAMANLQFGQGQNCLYDDYTIAQQLQNRLVDQKPLLDVWEPFLYKHEAFHKHMTILSDVGNLVRQVPLGSETLQGIQNEIEYTGTVGAGRYLATLDLCLGFLRRTGGDPTERLVSYCNRWLGEESLMIVPMHSFHTVQLQHVVSLYEGLEDSASVGIQALVNSRYRTPLSPDLVEELSSSVEVKRPWQEHTSAPADEDPKISADLFHSMLRRFLFRYLIGDQLNPTVPLSIYITDPRLIQWPEDVVDDVDDAFPPSLLVEHSHATYVYLTEMLKDAKVER